jgi:hypothetical protein
MMRLNLISLRSEVLTNAVWVKRRVWEGCDALVNREIEEALHGAHEEPEEAEPRYRYYCRDCEVTAEMTPSEALDEWASGHDVVRDESVGEAELTPVGASEGD